MEAASASDLEFAAVGYKEQLEQVKRLLVAEPGNAEYLQLHDELVEIVSLTEELLNTAPQILEQALEAGHQNFELYQGDRTTAVDASDSAAPSIGPSLPAYNVREQQRAEIGVAVGESGPSQTHQEDGGHLGPLHGHQDCPEHSGQHQHQLLGKRKQMHPRNKYADAPPDFDQLAAKYPSFAPYVYHSAAGRPNIEWTDFNASRELTRVLLDHDHGVKWWIPDGQLCPTVTNRANYIHWIEDLLYLSPAPWHAQGPQTKSGHVTGLDIGVGANCIYPLLGATLNGWKLVGTDVTPVALTWAQKNVDANPHLAPLIEIRSAKVESGPELDTKRERVIDKKESSHPEASGGHSPEDGGANTTGGEHGESLRSAPHKGNGPEASASERGPEESADDEDAPAAPPHPILDGVLRPGECFDFCMCNPPFFESMDEAAANPRTACGGTEAEMVYPGGEEEFVARIIADSCALKGRVHWYTSMVGKKGSLKKLVALLRKKRVAATETTEFVQGKTSRWGLAWSFTPRKMTAAMKEAVAKQLPQRTKISFTLQRLGRQTAAWTVLQAIREELQRERATCQVNEATFALQARIPAGALTVPRGEADDNTEAEDTGEAGPEEKRRRLETGGMEHGEFAVKVSVFQQAPGTLLVSAILTEQRVPIATTAAFGTLFDRVEEKLRKRFKSA
ncbi:hypothetical protein KFL_002700020 [Klebsormidium nitens]|uniref:U6 small nuclear RNA (adenine-(43)-N(6))-methyltransferase n=1 Tax=Klebsormidium nitens TaxID=105231 RepID=A0A1Y1I6E3_KLENI|nr:hypothetical protein KFL_002700020 [Klebsormidium nitens]|eukprot:GAQ86083.1 hypothetical protein KFL_002700020 [Klebsormidium nitens]